MKTNTATAASEIEHPPLACDSFGNLLPLPNGTAAWRVCRHTAGRPREITGPDKLALRFPLTTTIDELGRWMSQPAKDSTPKPSSPPSKKGMAWLRELFAKLSTLVRDAVGKAVELVKKSPLTIAAGAVIAMLLLV